MIEKDTTIVLAPTLSLGILAAVGVNVANALEVPGMNLRDGFHGARFLTDFLYAVQPPAWLGMALVGGLYLLYGAVAGCILGLLLRAVWNHV